MKNNEYHCVTNFEVYGFTKNTKSLSILKTEHFLFQQKSSLHTKSYMVKKVF